MSSRVRHLAPVLPPSAPPPASTLVVMTEADLRRIVADELRRALADHTPAPAAAPVDWIDAGEVATILGVSRDYVRRVEGLRRYGSPRRPRYRRSEVEAFLRDRAGAPLRG